MPIGLRFHRKHRRIGYRIKYLYYCMFRRDVLQKRILGGVYNEDKIFYVVKPDYQDGVEGLLSLVCRQVLYIDYAKQKGYIPFVDWKNYKTQYYDGVENVWDYFFKQISDVSIEEIQKSKNVYISGWTYKDINPTGLFSSSVFYDPEIRAKSSQILLDNISFSDDVEKLVVLENNNIHVESCLGVYLRGTDYIRLKPSGEYIQPSTEQAIKEIDKFIAKHNIKSIFLVTEDGNIYDKFRAKYGDALRIVSYDYFIRDYDGKKVLSQSGVLNEDKKRRGQDYLVKMILLAKCKYLVSSITQGSKFSYILNNGQYEDEFIFDLGLYK